MWGEGLFLPNRKKRLLKPLCVWHQFNYPPWPVHLSTSSASLALQHCPHPPFSESPTPQRTHSIATDHCNISTSWTKGASWAMWGWGPSTTLTQPASRHSEFQEILETTLVLPGKWIHLHAGRVGHPSSQGTGAPALGTLSDCTLVVHLYPLW